MYKGRGKCVVKKRVFGLFLVLALCLSVLPAGVSVRAEEPSSGLPTLHITLQDVDLDYIHESKENVSKKGTVVLRSAAGAELHNVALKQLKGRGNASWTMASSKRSYNIKLDKKTELIAGAGAAKSWCLLANNVHYAGTDTDRTGLANMAAFTLFQQVGGDSAISYLPIELYIDDPSGKHESYRGTYLLTEKVQVNAARVNITEPDMTESTVTRLVKADSPDVSAGEKAILQTGITSFQYCPGSTVKSGGGFLLECDSRYASEASWFRTRHGAAIVIKEPEYANLDQMRTIASYVQGFEDALYHPTGYNPRGKRYTDYIDLSSLAKKFLLDCFTAQYDIFKTSCFLYIDGNNAGTVGKLKAGPAWDYDYEVLTDDTLYHYVGAPKEKDRWTRVWVEQLLTKGDFVAALYDLNEGTFKRLIQTMADTTLPQYKAMLDIAGIRNGKKWNLDYESLSAGYLQRFKTRVNTWNTVVWTKNKVLGVTISERNGTLTAQVKGSAQSYQWYELVDAATATYRPIAGATGAVYQPKESGAYFVKAMGNPIGVGNTEMDGIAGSAMYSAPVHVGAVPNTSTGNTSSGKPSSTVPAESQTVSGDPTLSGTESAGEKTTAGQNAVTGPATGTIADDSGGKHTQAADRRRLAVLWGVLIGVGILAVGGGAGWFFVRRGKKRS